MVSVNSIFNNIKKGFHKVILNKLSGNFYLMCLFLAVFIFYVQHKSGDIVCVEGHQIIKGVRTSGQSFS